MAISKQLPLWQKDNTYSWRGINPTGASGYAEVPVCVNGYFELQQDALSDTRKLAYCKRPGIADAIYAAAGFSNLKCTNSGERIKGLCTSLDKTKVLYLTQDATKRYSNIWDSATNTLTQTDITANFSAGHYVYTVLDANEYGTVDPGTGAEAVYYAVNNGTDAALIVADGEWVKISDADFTGLGTVTNFVAINGYLFAGVISGTGAGRVYNSELNDAKTWTALGFYSANDIPGDIVWLARLRNMLVVFKQYSIEFAEEVGNPTPGSPLEPRKQYTKRIGCASASSIQEVSDGIIFMGTDERGKLGIFKLNKDSLELTRISTGLIDKSLQSPLETAAGFRSYSCDYAVDGSVRGQSQVIILFNKEFYTTVIPSAWSSTPLTMVYDNQLDIWTKWSTAFGGDATQDNTFVPSQSFVLNNNNGGFEICFANNFSGNTTSRFALINMLDYSSTPYAFRDQYEVGTSNIHTYPFVWHSDFIDMGTADRKFLHSIEFFYDSDPDIAVASATTFTLYFDHYDMDYNQDIVPAFRSITLDNAGFRRCVFRRLGSFRRKAFKFYSSNNFPMRVWAAEIVFDHGPDNA